MNEKYFIRITGEIQEDIFMGKVSLAINFAKACAKGLKSGKKIEFAAELKDVKLFVKPINDMLPSKMKELVSSRFGAYKISPEEKVIDALKEITTKSGKTKYAENALRAEIKKVNIGFGPKLDMKQYTDKRCREISMFAERSDVNLRDVAEFAQMPEDSFGFANSLSKDRFKIFKELMRYTQGDRFYIAKIGETNPRRFTFE